LIGAESRGQRSHGIRREGTPVGHQRAERIERARRDAEEELQIRIFREYRARRQREAWIPDWAKIAAVGLLIGLVVCIPLFLYLRH